MGPTIFAIFDDNSHAHRAVRDLLDAGVPKTNISAVLSDGGVDLESAGTDPAQAQTGGTILIGNDGIRGREDAFDNDIRTMPTQIRGDSYLNADLPGEMNPAQSDYPQSAMPSATQFSSAPADAQRDYNRGLEEDHYNAHYQGDVDRDSQRELMKDRERANEQGIDTDRGTGPSTAGQSPATPSGVFSTRGDEGLQPRLSRTDAYADYPVPTDDVERAKATHTTAGAADDRALTAPHGLSFTRVKGLGVVSGSGDIATGLIAISGAGATADQAVRYLEDQGVPADRANALAAAWSRGGSMVAVNVREAETDTSRIESILRNSGAATLERYGSA